MPSVSGIFHANDETFYFAHTPRQRADQDKLVSIGSDGFPCTFGHFQLFKHFPARSMCHFTHRLFQKMNATQKSWHESWRQFGSHFAIMAMLLSFWQAHVQSSIYLPPLYHTLHNLLILDRKIKERRRNERPSVQTSDTGAR